MAANVYTVAHAVLEKAGPMSAFKLQKLCYYAQAWHLAFYGRPLYPEPTEAWANGPVVRELYETHRGRFEVTVDDLSQYAVGALDQDEEEHLDRVLDAYAQFTPQQLVDMTHSEAPWREARGSLPVLARSNNVVSLQTMARFYRDLSADATAEVLAD